MSADADWLKDQMARLDLRMADSQRNLARSLACRSPDGPPRHDDGWQAWLFPALVAVNIVAGVVAVCTWL